MMLMYQSVFDEWYVSMMTHGSNARGDLYALLYLSVIVVALLTWTFPLFFSSREMDLSVKLKASGMYVLWSCVWLISGYVYRNAVAGSFFSPTADIISKLFIRTIGEFGRWWLKQEATCGGEQHINRHARTPPNSPFLPFCSQHPIQSTRSSKRCCSK